MSHAALCASPVVVKRPNGIKDKTAKTKTSTNQEPHRFAIIIGHDGGS
jgi:hypothetical protein